ncbi:MAG: GNAT family N-acetyltransferase [Beijerinckiaceae bacterium]
MKRSPATKASGKTARSRIVARVSRKLAPPVLRDAARRPVVKPTAPRPEKAPAPARKAPFRIHALGVRDEHPTDRPRIETLLQEAFGRTDEASIVERLRSDGDMVLALVAELEGEIIGHVAFSRVDARIDARALKALALAPLAVAPARQGRGVGSVLVASGLEAARTAGFEAVFVVGDAAYYERFGFSAPLAAPFESEWSDALLALELEPGSLAGAAGSLSHPRALRR